MSGARFIARNGAEQNVQPRKDYHGAEVGPAEAFKCLALIGDGGCEITSSLEAAKRALDGPLSENGFLRSNAVLAVVFLTDEDDCSVQVSRRAELDPISTDCSGNTSPDAPATCFGPPAA